MPHPLRLRPLALRGGAEDLAVPVGERHVLARLRARWTPRARGRLPATSRWHHLPHDHDDDPARGKLRHGRGLRQLPAGVSALRAWRLRRVPDDQPERLHLERRVPHPTVGALGTHLLLRTVHAPPPRSRWTAAPNSWARSSGCDRVRHVVAPAGGRGRCAPGQAVRRS